MLDEAQTEKLKQRLMAIPLTEAQAMAAMKVLIKAVNFLPNTLSSDSNFWDFADKTKKAARFLDISHQAYIDAILKQPTLFYMSAATIDAKIAGGCALLGVEKKAYVAAALRQPSLFYQSPVTIDANMTGASLLLGLEKNAYVASALEHPQLFTRSPATIKRNYAYVCAASRYIKAENMLQATLSYPVAFCLAPKNIHLRAIHAQASRKRFTLANFFTGGGRDKKSIEQDIVTHYRDLFNRTGKGLRTLQVLAEAGIISRLPDGVPAPAAPLRQRVRGINGPQ